MAKRHPAVMRAEEAYTAMELFDLAADMMNRVRGGRETQRRAMNLAKRLLDARNATLKYLDRAEQECLERDKR